MVEYVDPRRVCCMDSDHELRLIDVVTACRQRRYMVSYFITCTCGYQSEHSGTIKFKRSEIELYLIGALSAARLTHTCLPNKPGVPNG